MEKQVAEIFPEDILVATLHLVGRKTRIPHDQSLAAIFNDAASEYSDLFGDFAWNPVYKHSTTLSDTLQHIDLGGAIVRENAPTTKLYFTVAARTAGAYGASKLSKLAPNDQAAVKEVARRISERFSPQTAARGD